MNELITPNEEKTIESEFRLGAIVRRKVGCSTYQTVFEKEGEPPRPAVIKICEAEGQGLEAAVARWTDAMELQHPNLLTLYAAGSSRMEGIPAAYLVMERADESLTGVLARRALTVEELREMLDPILSVLEYLHKKGYAHNGLKPTNVFAVGDRLKLASDRVARFGEGGSAEEDVRALGALLLEVMTSPEGTYSPKPPFGEIVRRCLEEDPAKRWTLGQVRERLSGKTAEPAMAPPPPIEPIIPAAPIREPVRMRVEDQDEGSRGFPKWVLAALAALVAVVFLGAVLRKKEPAPLSVAPTVQVREAPRVAQSHPVTVEQAPPPRPQQIRAVSGGSKGGWSVIVAAYGAQAPAEKRAHSMAAKWPAFHVTVLERQRERARFLVVLGDRLSEDEAKALKERAVRSGLPRDTYIKRLM